MRQTVDVGMKLVEGQRLQNAILRAAGNYIPTCLCMARCVGKN
ncbi:hypothetical protein [Winogradskyella sp. PE311]